MAGSFSFEAIGTTWTIELYKAAISDQELAGVRQRVLSRIDRFDRYYSRFRDDSLVSEISRTACTYRLPPDGRELLDLHKDLYDVTGGAVTPLIGQVLADAGYDAAYSLQPKTLHVPPRWEDIIEYDFPKLTVKQPALLDFGAAGKGYLVDIIGQLLEEAGHMSYLVDAGGDMRHRGNRPLAVGLEHPADTSQVIGTLPLKGKSLCGSAGNRRSWAGLHHIMDPYGLRPVDDVVATWVLADTTIIADAMATCLFFMSAEALKKRYTFEYGLVRADYSLDYSVGFPATFFTDTEG